MSDVVRQAAWVPTAIGLLVILAGLAHALLDRRRAAASLASALALALEFFLAAGLLRLAALDTFAALGLAAFIIALRRVISYGVRFAVRAAGGAA
jgi:uncharacterized membrane protein